MRAPRKEAVPERPALAGTELAGGAAERGAVVAERTSAFTDEPAAAFHEAGRAHVARVAVGEVPDVEAIGKELVEQRAARARSTDHEDRQVGQGLVGPASPKPHLERMEAPDACSAQARSRGEGQAARQRGGHDYS